MYPDSQGRKVPRHNALSVTAGAALALALLACNALPAHAAELPAAEAAKIEYLIRSVAELRDAKFIRNGRSHDSQAAAKHLRAKLKAAGSRVKSAEDFIDKCASGSSMTGRPYRIRFAGGHEVEAREFFRQKLAEYPGVI
jgi:hypothetical protein